ncbi:hypothetical protein CN193_24815 [Sinorhizobium meliloti]|uniref:hypothetical protein n=1 Tax=Rhizobium meliloti TaxID=382 RepID=UPI000FE0F946|nr:hypothetical protein [Sinorhizobium meliloti]RVI98118.1 hypothetical protein CN193_24815 [Sinorhizobium meliloti]
MRIVNLDRLFIGICRFNGPFFHHSLQLGNSVVDKRLATAIRQKRADFILRYRPDFPIAVVDANARCDGLQQAKEYAEILA